MQVGVTRVDTSLPLPEYASESAAGFDLYARLAVQIAPGELARIPTNVIVAVPEGHVLLVTLRSGAPDRKRLLMPHGVGVIDPDYRGPNDEVQVLVYNFGDAATLVERGERIAQGMVVPLPRVTWREIQAEGPSRGGFGSTG